MDSGERLVGISEYVPTQQDEIKLAVGNVVTVLFSYEDGWVLARNETTGAVGLLPRNFLDKEGATTLSVPDLAGKPSTRTASLVVRTRPSTRKPVAAAPIVTPPAPIPAPVTQPAAVTAPGTEGGGERLVGICEYIPSNADEIKLAVGNSVTVLFSYEDGWILARNESTGAVGLLPRNFLDVETANPLPSGATRSPTVRNASLMNRKPRDAGPKSAGSSAAPLPTVDPTPAPQPSVPAVTVTPDTSGKERLVGIVGLLPRNFLEVDSGLLAPQAAFGRTPTTRTASLVVRGGQSSSATAPAPIAAQTVAPPPAAVKPISSNPVTTLSTYDINHAPQQSQAPAVPRGGSGDPASLRNAATYPPPILPPIKLDGVNCQAEAAPAAKKKLLASVRARGNRVKIPANMGTLKVAVVGDMSIGKTALIKKFLSMPEIVLADPLPPAAASGSIREIRASTIPASEVQVGEERLNLTFVDTPGYGSALDAVAIIGPVGEYCLKQFAKSERAFSREITRNQIIRFMNAGTGAHSHVDVCIYGILHRLTPVDLEYMRRLSRFVTVVPVLLKCDTMYHSEVCRLKVEVLEALAACGVRLHGFGLSHEECTALARGGELGAPPFAVSSLDTEEEAAVAAAAASSSGSAAAAGPLRGRCESEFATLKTALFFNHIGDLRNMAAEKFAEWYEC
ncbi:hypothetical protein HK405_002564 [Cladochytrium tenue]|nr:hypothetical protein HK405_002564 [Cladochytrium tenue]